MSAVEVATYKNYVDGTWVPARSAQVMESLNPATGEVLGLVPKSGPEDVEAAVQAAAPADEAGGQGAAPRRAEILFRVAELILQRKEDLARLMTQEMGKVLPETRGDVQEAIDMAYFIAGEGRRLHGYTAPSEMPHKAAYCVRAPLGVVGVITPWNFPMAIPSWKILPALVCGNTVVFKPASYTPLLGLKFVEIFEEAGLPPGVLSIVTGPGGAAGDAVVQHPQVRVISFTGSTETGLRLAEKFAPPGQHSPACSRIIVHRDARAELTERLVERAGRLRLGDGLRPDTDVGPVVSESQLQRVNEYVEIGKREGARLLTGGTRVADGALARGYFYAPTIFDSVRPGMRIEQEEIFGPVTDLIEADSLEQAVAILNGTPYGLSASIFTRDINAAMEAIDDIETGIVYVNHGTIGAEGHLPFGGTKNTGNGHREGGTQVLDVFSERKAVYIDFSGRRQRAQIGRE